MARQKLIVAGLIPAMAMATFSNAIAAEEASQPEATKGKAKPHIDLAFCIDTTGSMQAEIDAVKSKTKEIVARLSGAKPTPIIRVGVVAFRDRGDAYVTKVFPFSENIDQVVKDISDLKADGGGDEPEAVNEALHAAVHDLKWSSDSKTVKQLFLIGDAGPKEYPNDYSWENESKEAIANGIQVNTVGCDGLSSTAQNVFAKIAKLTDGTAETLTYKQEVVNKDGKTETIISSGGASFSVAGASDAWREGASALRGKGLLTPMPTTTSASFEMTYGDEGAATAPSAGFSSGVTSRKESNLADIVVRKTKKALEEKMPD